MLSEVLHEDKNGRYSTGFAAMHARKEGGGGYLGSAGWSEARCRDNGANRERWVSGSARFR